MHIAVCVKQILDPEISPRAFKIDPVRKEAVPGSGSLVIGPFDLNALEVAVQLKERYGGRVTVLTLGSEKAKEALRRALAMGADAAVLIDDGQVAAKEPSVTARVLAAAIRRLDSVDLVLCGRQSGEWDFGQVGALLAEELGMPFVPFVPRLEVDGQVLRLEREAEGGLAVVEAPRPCVASITNANDNVPRLPKVKDIMMANRKPITTYTAADLGLGEAEAGDAANRLEVLELFIPEVKSECEFVEGDSGAEKGVNLARKLVERKVI
ncbi:MAG TPA: electron transfer flavoprotein subunit beta/FixA family protein [Limnochordales bacterium]|nr:electron transfer flavoprotein subunit beta/FixA family protein [Limnochordales bacterium]